MKKLYPLLSVLFFIYWGCENEDQVLKEVNYPGPVTLSLKPSSNVLEWTMNEDTDFFKYSLYGSSSSQSVMQNSLTTLIYETETRLDTSYTLDSSHYFSSYQVYVININEYISYSNIIGGWVTLWGEYYFIDDTDSLLIHGGGLTGQIPAEIGELTNLTILSLVDNSLLTGSIPPQMGNLTNLIHLNLSDNQLTGVKVSYNVVAGEIEETICNININWSDSSFFNISNNQLCPPYPPCIEDYLGVQNTTNCD